MSTDGNKSCCGTLTSYASYLSPCATVRPMLPFAPGVDAEHLQQAMKGLNTDEEAIIDILARRTSTQRQEIMKHYHAAYGRDLVSDLKRELHGKFEDVIVAIMAPLHEFLAHELYRAIRNRGSDERSIVEILCSNDNKAIRTIKIAYREQFGRTLDVEIRNGTSNDFQMFLEDLICRERDEDDIYIPGLPSRVAKQLYSAAGEGRNRTDKDELRRIFTSYSYDTLKKVFREYRLLADRSVDEALRHELVSGDFLKGLLAAYYCIQDPCVFFTHELHASMQGLGTRDHCLIRLVVSRCEVDMKAIKIEYKKVFGKSLKRDIRGDTHGDYRRVLLALIKA